MKPKIPALLVCAFAAAAHAAAPSNPILYVTQVPLPDEFLTQAETIALNKMSLVSTMQIPSLGAVPFIFLTAKGTRAEVRHGMNLGADDYLAKPFTAAELLDAITARLQRAGGHTSVPAFTPQRLERLGLTAREAEVLFWLAQGKANSDIAAILDMAMPTVKTHLTHIFEKLGVENRTTAVVRALETIMQP